MSTEDQSESEDSKIRIKPGCLWALGILALVIVIFGIWRISVAWGVEKQLQAIRKAGEPVNVAELNASYPTVEPQENSALYWVEAAGEIVPNDNYQSQTIWTRFILPHRSKAFTNDSAQEVRGVVDSNAVAFGLIRRAAAMPKSRYQVDLEEGLRAQLPHLSQVKQCSRLLQLKVAVDSAQFPDEGSQAILQMLAAGRSLASEPVLISQLVRYRINDGASESLQYLLNHAALSDSSLLELASAFGRADDSQSLQRAYFGERAQITTIQEFPEILPADDTEFQGTIWFLNSPIMRGLGFIDRDLNYFLSVMRTNIQIAARPDPDRFRSQPDWDQIQSEARSRFYVLSSMTILILSRSISRDVEHRARIRVTQTAIATERYTLKHGKLPGDLKALVPDFMPHVPIDPFDGAPLRYQLRPHGYIVYSIGSDAKDDGGAEPPEKRKPAKVPEDITFVVDRAARFDLTR